MRPEPSSPRVQPEGEEPHDADGDVRAVEAGQDEEARPEEVGLEREPFVVEVRELVGLEAEEHGAEHDHGHDGGERGAAVSSLDGIEGDDHRERAHQQHEGADGGEGDVEHVRGERPDDALVLVDHVRGDQRPEEQGLRPQEDPEAELPHVEPRIRVGLRMVLRDRVLAQNQTRLSQ